MSWLQQHNRLLILLAAAAAGTVGAGIRSRSLRTTLLVIALVWLLTGLIWWLFL
jgi:hypothetical protein